MHLDLILSAARFVHRLKLEDSSAAFECVNELIVNQGLQLHLKDFDNHLDDISNDWTNKTMNQTIRAVTQS